MYLTDEMLDELIGTSGTVRHAACLTTWWLDSFDWRRWDWAEVPSSALTCMDGRTQGQALALFVAEVSLDE